MRKRIAISLLWVLMACLPAWSRPSTLTTGDRVPNFKLINHRGEKVEFSDFKGKGVILSFLYTQCPYPDKCAMIGSKLKGLAELSKKIGQDDKLQVLAITIDPVRDDPERLRQYAQGFDETHKNWNFLTGSETEIARVAGAFGVIYWTENGVIEHNMRTAFVDKTGRVQFIKSGSDWKAGAFAAQIKPFLD